MKSLGSFFLLILCVWLGGCQSDEDLRTSDNTGFLVTLTDELEQAYTRATPAELGKPIKEQFKLLVVDTATGKETYSGQCSESVLVKAGLYNLTATFGDNPIIALDAPYYEGKLEGQEVKTGEMTSVEIPCSVANALLSVSFNHESLKKAFENYYVTVSVNDQAVEIDSTGGKSAYFRANSSVKLVFHGYLSGTGQEMTYDIPEEDKFQNVVARTHVKVTLGLNSEDLSSGVGISVEKLDTEIVSVTSTIPVEYMPKPKLEAEGFSNNELTFAETEKKAASVHLKLASPLQELKMRFHFEDAQFASLNDQDYLLSKDKAALENALGITLPDVNATDATIDFSNLIAKMQTNAGATTRNVIELDAQANNRWSSDKEADALARTFTLNCNKPVFHVSIYPGNIWTKEFTVNHLLAEDVESGDYEALGQKMRYQFSTNGTDGWTDLGKDLRKADLIPGTTYYIRGLYRDVIESEAVAVTTYPQIALENGGLQGGSISYGSDKRGSKYGAVYVWSGWASLNELTCDDTHAFIAGNTAFNSRSGTRVTTDARQNGDGEAVWISTIGWGYGGTSYHTITPGELFLGSLANVNHDNDTATKSYGISYASHPTSLRFWYKYAPFNGDKSDIYIQILGNEGEVLGKASLNEANIISSYTECLLDIEYDEAYLAVVPAKLVVVFKTGNNLSVEARGDTGITGEGDPAYRGSELYIDDISLVYDK